MTPPTMNLPLAFAPHAVERYQEHLKPCLSIENAAKDLIRIAAHARVSLKAPAWLGGSTRKDVVMFLEIGDAVFPLAPDVDGTQLVALTCRTRGTISTAVRSRRKARRVRARS